MKHLPVLIPVLLLAAACDEERQIEELKSLNNRQSQQVDRLLESHQSTLDQLTVQLDRQAQSEAGERTAVRTGELATGTMIVLGCSLAATLAMLLRKRGPDATRPGP